MSLFARSLILVALAAAVAHAQGLESRRVRVGSVEEAQRTSSSARVLPPAAGQPVIASGQLPTGTVSRANYLDSNTPLAPAARREEEAPLPIRKPLVQPRLAPQTSRAQGGGAAISTVVGSLIVVLGSFLLLAWLSRKAAPRGLTPLPAEVVESLGRTALNARQQMQLIRVGRKLVLLSITPHGAEPLTEITDAEEVERLCGLCRQQAPGSVSQSFRQVLSQYAREPAPGGFVGAASESRREVAQRGGRSSRYAEEEHV